MEHDNGISSSVGDILKKRLLTGGQTGDTCSCPGDIDMADFISGNMPLDVSEKISGHIASCPRCLDIAAISLKALNERDYPLPCAPAPSVFAKRKTAALTAGKGINLRSFLKRDKFMIISCLFLMLSFVFKRYFMQLLLLCGICGMKWIMDTGSTRALIMIYDTWKHRKEHPDDDNNSARNNRDITRLSDKTRF